MNKLTVKAAAKVNLALDVTGRLPNGYHLIESIFQTVGIYDIVTAEIIDGNEIILECSVPEIPCNEKNIAYKAVQLFKELSGLEFGCRITIEKNIPSQAGMGGGSADGAAVFYLLNQLLHTNFTFEDILPYAAKLGADVPFFLMGGTAYAEGIGEKLTKIRDIPEKVLLIAKGKDGISTPEAYRKIDNLENPVHPETKKLLECIQSGENNVYRYYGNLFEQAKSIESVNIIKSVMLENGAFSSVMTGSGSAVFGEFHDMESAEKCRLELLKSHPDFYAEVCTTVNQAFIQTM